MPTIDLRGETLFYERTGKGPPLLLIHSLGTGAWLWRRQIARWSDAFDVIAADARGHGRSTANGEPLVAEMAADLAALLGALGLTGVQVVAISMGGPIAAHLATQAPGLVRSLAIADSFASQGEAGAERAETIAATVRSIGMAEFGRRYARDTLQPGAAPDLVEELAGSLGGMDPATYTACARSVFTSDVRETLAALRALPVRVVVGDRDARTPPALSEEIASLTGAGDVGLIPGAGHLSNLDRPEAFEAAILPFLRANA